MILILGGTAQGRSAVQMADQSGNIFFYSTKGGLQEVISHNGVRITGGMDTQQMEQFCRNNEIELLVDAAHPFAEQLHKTIYEVSRILDIKVIRFEREFPERDNEIIWCDSYRQAVRKMQDDGISRLLALTGVNTINNLKSFWENIPQCYFRVLNRKESVEIAKQSGFPQENLIFFNDAFLLSDNGNHFTSEDIIKYEQQILAKTNPDAIITKESGISGFFREKVAAAKKAGVRIYSIKRPELPESFINVYGPVGLRKQIERLVPGFFPLRIGYTTGTCATAATVGALQAVLYGKELESVFVTLPSLEIVELPLYFTSISGMSKFPISCSASCSVIKDAGDDPDITNAGEIISTVELIKGYENGLSDGNYVPVSINFLQGEGVGRVTLPGLGLEIGAPAINATPRRMIENEIHGILKQYYNNESEVNLKIACINVTISVTGGCELAKRTFNPRLGIVNGISIIGTSGIVKPFSKEAFLDSIKKGIEVAVAVGGRTLVLNSGAKSEKRLKEYVEKIRMDQVKSQLPSQSFVQYGNFIGDTINIAASVGVEEIILGIMLGKAIKLAEGNLDTHSKVVTMNKEFVRQVIKDSGCSEGVYDKDIDSLTLARELWDILSLEDAKKFFPYLIELCYKHCAPLFPGGELKILLIPNS